MIRNLLVASLLSLCQCASAQSPAPPGAVAIYEYRIVATYKHDPEAFTQGLVYLDGGLYESTGMVGRSTIRRVRIEDGHVLQSVNIPPGQFGEGIVDWGFEIISITWTEGIGHRWDRATLRRLSEWRYSGEGWGLTRNDSDIIMSDGTSELRLLDPETLAERRRISVTFEGLPLTQLNELEWVNGKILANVWQTSFIAMIDPASGVVTGVIDLTALAAVNGGDGDKVLNGIAYDRAADRLFVTGKNWPNLYEIDLAAPPAP